MVGWVVCCGVGWKEGEVNGPRVQDNKGLSAKSVMPDSARPHANLMFRSRRAPRIELTGQNTNQPKREFLENLENLQNLENQEIRKIRTNMQKARITQRSRKKKRKSEKQDSRTKPRKQKQIHNKTQSKKMQRGKCERKKERK